MKAEEAREIAKLHNGMVVKTQLTDFYEKIKIESENGRFCLSGNFSLRAEVENTLLKDGYVIKNVVVGNNETETLIEW